MNSTRDPRVDAYISKAQPFAKPILTHLRTVVHDACPGVQETLKWGVPHFDYKGIFCGMASFKEHATFGFWKAALLKEDLPNKSTLARIVKAAAKLNDEGVKVARMPKAKKPPLARPAVRNWKYVK